MPKSAVVQSRMDILDLATVTRHLIKNRNEKPSSISELISISIHVLSVLLNAEPFTSPTEALEFMNENGYGKTLKLGSKALAKQIADEELALLSNISLSSNEPIGLTKGTMEKLNKIRKEKGTS